MKEPWFARPTWPHLGRALALGVFVSAWWILIYGGADLLSEHIPYRVRLHLDAELHIPFVPASVVVYMSIYLLFLAAPFVLRRAEELDALAASLAAITLAAGVCFLVFPGESYFATPPDAGGWSDMVRFAKRLALTHNFAPSLHVGLSVTCVTIYARRAPAWGRVALWGWALAVGLSTMLLHQHYLVDVISGFALGWLGARLVYDRWTQKR